jgi:hypothetical protein
MHWLIFPWLAECIVSSLEKENVSVLDSGYERFYRFFSILCSAESKVREELHHNAMLCKIQF